VSSAGTVTVDFAAETAKFTAELKKVNEKLTGMQSSFKSLESVAKGALGFLSVGVFTNFVKGSLAAADALGDVADQIGISVTALSQLQFAAQNSDLDIEQLNKSLIKMSNNVSDAFNGVDSAEKALRAFGLTASQLRGLNLEDQLGLIADQFASVVPPADRVRVATDLFGKGAEKLIPLLLQGKNGLKEFAAEADRLGISLDAGATKAIDRANKAIENLQLRASRGTANLIGTAIIDSFGSGDALIDIESRIDRVKTNLENLQRGGFMGRSEDEITRQKIALGELEDTRRLLLYDQARVQAKKDIAAQSVIAATAEKQARDAADAAKITDLGTETFGPSFNAQDQLAFEVELDDALIKAEQDTQAELTRIIREGDEERARLLNEGSARQFAAEQEWRERDARDEQDRQDKLNQIKQAGLNAAQSLLTAYGGRYRKFAIALLAFDKAKAIADIVIQTQTAATNAFASGSKINVAFGYASAAAAIAFGAARVAAVLSTFVGTGNSPSIGSPGNPVFTNNTDTSLANDERPTASSQQVTQVIFQGPVYNTDDFQRSIVDALRDVSDRDVIVFSGSSAQAQTIRAA
jgi:hypothetical protein